MRHISRPCIASAFCSVWLTDIDPVRALSLACPTSSMWTSWDKRSCGDSLWLCESISVWVSSSFGACKIFAFLTVFAWHLKYFESHAYPFHCSLLRYPPHVAKLEFTEIVAILLNMVAMAVILVAKAWKLCHLGISFCLWLFALLCVAVPACFVCEFMTFWCFCFLVIWWPSFKSLSRLLNE